MHTAKPAHIKVANTLVLLLLCFSLIIVSARCFIKISEQYLWVDELLTLWVSSGPLTVTLERMYSGVDGQLPLVYLAYWAAKAIQLSDTTIRLLTVSTAFLSLTGLGIFLCRRCKFSWQSISISLSLSFLFSFAYYTTLSDIRGYTFLLGAFILSLISITLLDEKQNPKHIVLNGICQGLLINSHPFGLFFSAAFGITYIIKTAVERTKQRFRPLILSYIITGLMAIPIIPTIIASRDLADPPWYPTVTLPSFPFYIVNSMPTAGLIVLLITIISAPLMCSHESTKSINSRPLIYALGAIIFGMLLWSYSLYKPLIISRYLLPLLATNIVVVSFILSRFRLNLPYSMTILFTAIGLSYYSTSGHLLKSVSQMAAFTNTADAGEHDNLLLGGHDLFIGADIGTLLPRAHYNLHHIKYYAISEDPQISTKAGTTDKITDRLITQGYPLKRLSAEQAYTKIKQLHITRVILLPNRMGTPSNSETAKLVELLSSKFTTQLLNGGEIYIFTAHGHPTLQ